MDEMMETCKFHENVLILWKGVSFIKTYQFNEKNMSLFKSLKGVGIEPCRSSMGRKITLW